MSDSLAGVPPGHVIDRIAAGAVVERHATGKVRGFGRLDASRAQFVSQIDADRGRRRAQEGVMPDEKAVYTFFPPFRADPPETAPAAVADGRRMRPAEEPLEDPWDKVPYDPRKFDWRR